MVREGVIVALHISCWWKTSASFPIPMEQALGKCSRMVSLWSGSSPYLEVLCNVWIHWEIIRYQNGRKIRDLLPAFLHAVWRVACGLQGYEKWCQPLLLQEEARGALYSSLGQERGKSRFPDCFHQNPPQPKLIIFPFSCSTLSSEVN